MRLKTRRAKRVQSFDGNATAPHVLVGQGSEHLLQSLGHFPEVIVLVANDAQQVPQTPRIVLTVAPAKNVKQSLQWPMHSQYTRHNRCNHRAIMLFSAQQIALPGE